MRPGVHHPSMPTPVQKLNTHLCSSRFKPVRGAEFVLQLFKRIGVEDFKTVSEHTPDTYALSQLSIQLEDMTRKRHVEAINGSRGGRRPKGQRCDSSVYP